MVLRPRTTHLTRPWLGILAAGALVLGLLVPSGNAGATTITLNFELSELGDPPPSTPPPLDGLTVAGITFGFSGGTPPPDAVYGRDEPRLTDGSPATVLVAAPSLEGPIDGLLTLTFAQPVTELAFDVALDDIFPLPIGFTVALVLSDGSSSSLDVAMALQGGAWIEGSFSYSGDPVTQAVVDFNESMFRSTFWLDNLVAVTVALPEPGIAALLACGLAGLVIAGGRSGRA